MGSEASLEPGVRKRLFGLDPVWGAFTDRPGAHASPHDAGTFRRVTSPREPARDRTPHFECLTELWLLLRPLPHLRLCLNSSQAPSSLLRSKIAKPNMYHGSKLVAKEYQAAKACLFKAFIKAGLGAWVEKPTEQDQFSLTP